MTTSNHWIRVHPTDEVTDHSCLKISRWLRHVFLVAEQLFVEPPEIDDWTRRCPTKFPSNAVTVAHKSRGCNDLGGLEWSRGGVLSGRESAQ
ncbi:MAG: hypothetical protein IID44_25505 [Planctomycetes bacterium]|nr:hypothetical protein [Planctomycetota bacterium]